MCQQQHGYCGHCSGNGVDLVGPDNITGATHLAITSQSTGRSTSNTGAHRATSSDRYCDCTTAGRVLIAVDLIV